MKCGYCGKNIRDDATFCTYCGHNIADLESDAPPAKTPKFSYLVSLLTLLAVLVMLWAGGYSLLHGAESRFTVTVSASHISDSDAVAVLFPSTKQSPPQSGAPVGKWHCTDRAAADYSRSDYGVDVDILLELKKDGTFRLNYKMADTGISALHLSLNGQYRVQDGLIAFQPDLSKLNDETGSRFFKNHGKTPTFAYIAADDSLTLQYDNDTQVIFTRA
jgi:hypothetical protein